LTRKSKDDSLDACPFPPDKTPPPKTLPTNLLEQMDRFFEGWSKYLGLVTIAGIILAYSLIVVPPPLISRSTIPGTWNTQIEFRRTPVDYFKWIKVKEPDYSAPEQMILEGDEVLEFRDQTVRFNDLVLVKDNAKIILRNSTLMAPDYEYAYENIFYEWAGMVFNDSASLEAYDSVIVPVEHVLNIGFIGSSSCYLENTLVANCSLCFDESASLEAVGSTVYEIQADRSSSLKIVDSYIGALRQYYYWREKWFNPVEEVKTSAHLTDSQLGGLMVRIVNSSSCQVVEHVGEHGYWNIYDAFKIDGCTMNVTLINSELSEPLNIYAINSEVNVTETDVLGIQASMSRVNVEGSEVFWLTLCSNSSLMVKDSNIYRLGTQAYPVYEEYLRSLSQSSFRQDATIMGTRIEYLGLNTNCKVNFTDVYVGEASIGGFEAILRGSVTWGPNISTNVTPYDRFAVTQVFDVYTQGQKRVLPGVNLVLTDKDSNVVWEGISDENGEASFNITFCSYYPLREPFEFVTNYMDEWKLTALSAEVSREASLALFRTGSPIMLEFPEDKPVLPINNTTLTYASIIVILLATAMKLRQSYF